MTHLANVLFPAAVILAAFLYLWVSGLLVTVSCLPRDRMVMAVLIAPLTAICLLYIFYQYNFYVFVRPYAPRAVHFAVWTVSITAFLGASRFRHVPLTATARDVAHALRAIVPYGVASLSVLVVVCSFFWSSGLEMFSAGQDELGYVNQTSHLMTVLNTGSDRDIPIGRADHYVTDYVGNSLNYNPGWRYGANYLLADLAQASDLPLVLTFPLLVGLVILITVFALPAALTALFEVPTTLTCLTQVALAGSGLMVMLHFQGSLAHLASMGIRTTGLAIITWALAFSTSPGSLVLAAIFAAGWLIVYFESAGFGLVVPLLAIGAIEGWRLVTQRDHRTWFFARTALLIIGVYAVIPDVVRGFVHMHLDTLRANAAAHSALSLEGIAGLIQHAHAVLRSFLPSMLGLAGHYDSSAINQTFFLRYLAPWSPEIFLLLIVLALAGFIRLPYYFAAGFGGAVVSLAFVSLAAAARDDFLISIRATQMAIPLIFMGVTGLLGSTRRNDVSCRIADANGAMLAAPPDVASKSLRGPANRRNWAGIAAATLVFAAFIGCNVSAVWRTIAYVNSYSLATDPTIRRLNPEAPEWSKLRAALRSPSGVPVLLSGFDNTPTPHWLAIGIDPVPHILGESVVRFWSAMRPQRVTPDAYNRMSFARGPREVEALVEAQPTWNWDQTYQQLIASSVKALVPVSGGYPEEWGRSPSLAGPRAERFVNMCDVIDRGEPASVTLDRSAAPDGEDQLGPYWGATTAWTAAANLEAPTKGIMEIRFSGGLPHVDLTGVDAASTPGTATVGQERALRFRGLFTPESRIIVRGTDRTRLRAITFYRVP